MRGAVDGVDAEVEFAVAQVDASAGFDFVDQGGVGAADGQGAVVPSVLGLRSR